MVEFYSDPLTLVELPLLQRKELFFSSGLLAIESVALVFLGDLVIEDGSVLLALLKM